MNYKFGSCIHAKENNYDNIEGQELQVCSIKEFYFVACLKCIKEIQSNKKDVKIYPMSEALFKKGFTMPEIN